MSLIKDAIKKGDSISLTELLTKGEDFNETYSWTQWSTPIHFAVEKDNPKCIKALIAAGANVNIKNEYGDTPLHLAAQFGKFNSLKALLECGADPNVPGQESKIVLEYAIRGNQTYTNKFEIVSLLLSSGADINKCDKNGNTLLHFAVYDGIFALAEFLIANGAKNIKNIKGKTPYDDALEDGKDNLAQLIKSKIGLSYSPLNTKRQASTIEESKSKSECFIATVIYGSRNANEVQTLRQWRDQHLSSTKFGRLFINIYYKIGPFLASFISHTPLLNTLLRKAIDHIIKHIKRKHCNYQNF